MIAKGSRSSGWILQLIPAQPLLARTARGERVGIAICCFRTQAVVWYELYEASVRT